MQDGIDFGVVAIGVFVISEVIITAEKLRTGSRGQIIKAKSLWIFFREFIYSLGAISRGTLLLERFKRFFAAARAAAEDTDDKRQSPVRDSAFCASAFRHRIDCLFLRNSAYLGRRSTTGPRQRLLRRWPD